MEEIDLYEVLEISKGASKAEIKKAYHKKALSSHPDKVPLDQREEAEITFKAVSQAYEILYDDQKKNLYDTHGMSAFENGRGGQGPEVDINDIFSMFGMGGGGMPPGFAAMPHGPRKGRDEEQKYEVTLEELYRGKTVKFASTKNVICNVCKGSGGKEKATPKECTTCHGQGYVQALRQMGGLITQETVLCSACKGAGKIFKDKDRCKKCKGERVTEQRKLVEIYIPRGARHGERVVLAGEADQVPDQEPGDLVFVLSEQDHPLFSRSGADLLAVIDISLSEALCGFSRVVLKHLDGRGIQLTSPKGSVLKPNQCLVVKGEGMPIKKSEAKGDLYLRLNIIFPDEKWMLGEGIADKLQALLPKPEALVQAETVDEVSFDTDGDIEEFGHKSGGAHGQSAWVDEDDDEEGAGEPQCATQ